MDIGHAGAIVGTVLGLVGGGIGTYYSIRNTAGPRERRYVIRTAVILWTSLAMLAVVLYLFPRARLYVWIASIASLPVWVSRVNRRQLTIRQDEQSGRRL